MYIHIGKALSIQGFIYTLHIYIYVYMQDFSQSGEWGRVPPTCQKFAHPLSTKKNFPIEDSPPNQIFPRTTKQQFSSYSPIKISLLAVAIALTPFLF